MAQHKKMFQELNNLEILEQAQKYAYNYLKNVDQQAAFPSNENLSKLINFDEDLPEKPTAAKEVLSQLDTYGQLLKLHLLHSSCGLKYAMHWVSKFHCYNISSKCGCKYSKAK